MTDTSPKSPQASPVSPNGNSDRDRPTIARGDGEPKKPKGEVSETSAPCTPGGIPPELPLGPVELVHGRRIGHEHRRFLDARLRQHTRPSWVCRGNLPK